MFIPNTEIFNKSFTNWTVRDDIIRCVINVKTSRHDNPHTITLIISTVLSGHELILKDPAPEVYLSDMNDSVIEFELRYFINIRKVTSKARVKSAVLMALRDEFTRHGIKPPFPRHDIFLHDNAAQQGMLTDFEEQPQLRS
jgi:potassium efflux system protein